MDPTNGHGKILLAFGKSASKLERDLMKKVTLIFCYNTQGLI